MADGHDPVCADARAGKAADVSGTACEPHRWRELNSNSTPCAVFETERYRKHACTTCIRARKNQDGDEHGLKSAQAALVRGCDAEEALAVSGSADDARRRPQAKERSMRRHRRAFARGARAMPESFAQIARPTRKASCICPPRRMRRIRFHFPLVGAFLACGVGEARV